MVSAKRGGRCYLRRAKPTSYLAAICCLTKGKSKQSLWRPKRPASCMIKNANPVAALNPAKELRERGGCSEEEGLN